MTWKPTAESIAVLALDPLKNLRKNADDRQMADIVALCDAELERRKPVKPPRAVKAKKTKATKETAA